MTFDRARALGQAGVVHFKRPNAKPVTALCGDTYATAVSTVEGVVNCQDCIEWLHA